MAEFLTRPKTRLGERFQIGMVGGLKWEYPGRLTDRAVIYTLNAPVRGEREASRNAALGFGQIYEHCSCETKSSGLHAIAGSGVLSYRISVAV